MKTRGKGVRKYPLSVNLQFREADFPLIDDLLAQSLFRNAENHRVPCEAPGRRSEIFLNRKAVLRSNGMCTYEAHAAHPRSDVSVFARAGSAALCLAGGPGCKIYYVLLHIAA